MPYKDPEKHKEHQRAYDKTRNQLPEYKQYKRAYGKEYRQRPEVKERKRKYYQQHKEEIYRKNTKRNNERSKEWRIKNREKERIRDRLRYQKRKESMKNWGKEYRQRSEVIQYNREYIQTSSQRIKNRNELVRLEVLTFLCHGTPKCQNPNCAVVDGMTDVRALQIDHKNGNGCVDRNRTESWRRYSKRIYQHSERYQVLCANCNAIKVRENGENRCRRNKHLVIYVPPQTALAIYVPDTKIVLLSRKT